MISTRLSETSKEFRIHFLLTFTKELIRHTKMEDFTKLKTVIRKRDPQQNIIDEERDSQDVFKDFQVSIMHEHPIVSKIQSQEARKMPIFQFSRGNTYVKLPGQRNPILKPTPPTMQNSVTKRPLSIPDYPLPSTVRHITPIAMQTQIDLGKLNSLVQDQNILSIECNGADTPLTVKGSGGTRITNIILTKDEVGNIIRAFSTASKIPLNEGVFKAAVGSLIISAIVSEIIGSQFIIKKISPQGQLMSQRF